MSFNSKKLSVMDKRLHEWAQGGIIPAIAAKVLHRGETVFEGAYGRIAPEKSYGSMKVDTIFPICSLTKPVVCALMAVLQEEGLLDFNEPVKTFLPEFTGDFYGAVRIWHLMCHSSGLIDWEMDKHFNEIVKNKLGIKMPDDWHDDAAMAEAYAKIRKAFNLPEAAYNDEIRNDTWYAVALSAPPTHPVQRVMSYNNHGYSMLKMIITRVTGSGFDKLMREKLLEPLKMNDTHFIFPKEKIERFVQRGKEFCGGEWLNKHVLQSESAGGGLKSTVADMTRFGQMFLNNGILEGVRILSSASIQEITKDHNANIANAVYNGETVGSSWGLGWNIRAGKKDTGGVLRSATSFEHGGYGCVALLCDPVHEVVSAFFTVCKEDIYYKLAHFNNMVVSSLDD